MPGWNRTYAKVRTGSHALNLSVLSGRIAPKQWVAELRWRFRFDLAGYWSQLSSRSPKDWRFVPNHSRSRPARKTRGWHLNESRSVLAVHPIVRPALPQNWQRLRYR